MNTLQGVRGVTQEQVDRLMLKDIHTAIVGSVDGKKGINERLRVLEAFKDTFHKWLNVVIGIALTNVGMLIYQLIFLKTNTTN